MMDRVMNCHNTRGYSSHVDERALECQKMAQQMRIKMLDLALGVKGSMHWGGDFSTAEILAVLYREVLNCKNTSLSAMERDKFILSKGHAALALYTAMYQVGLLSEEQLGSYQQDGSLLTELVQANEELGFEASGGSLGLDPSYAVGVALLAKRKGYGYKVYVEVGDGELDEGNIWEAIMAASQYKLDNLTMIADMNAIQLSGKTSDIMSWENLQPRLESFGWNVVPVDGHDCLALLDAFTNHHKADMPLAVLANTVKGKGVSFMENDYHWHDSHLKGEILTKAREEVTGHA